MRYAVMADIHSNLEALDAVLSALSREGIDSFLCCGDIIGYGADPQACLDRVQALEMTCVAGNHDWGAAGRQDVEDFNPWARAALLWTRSRITEQDRKFLGGLPLVHQNKDLSMAHGTLHAPEDFFYMDSLADAGMTFRLLEQPVCFVAHNHMPAIIVKKDPTHVQYSLGYSAQLSGNEQYIVNVGSVGQPRDGRPESAYCVYDTQAHTIEIKRVAYDISRTREKIVRAGLPVQLANRLVIGF